MAGAGVSANEGGWAVVAKVSYLNSDIRRMRSPSSMLDWDRSQGLYTPSFLGANSSGVSSFQISYRENWIPYLCKCSEVIGSKCTMHAAMSYELRCDKLTYPELGWIAHFRHLDWTGPLASDPSPCLVC